MIDIDYMFNSLWCFVDRTKIAIVFYWLSFTGQKYPMWFIRMLDGKTSNVALVRDRDTQSLYECRPLRLRNEFIASLFDERLVSPDIPFRFVPNNFPYFVENGIIHYVFWIRPGYQIDHERKSLRKTIGRHVMSRFHRPLDFYYFRNSDENKSIAEIEHYHVFVRQYPSMWIIDAPC